MDIIHDLLGYDKIKIFQNPDMFSFSLDSVLLADFVEAKPKTKKIIDLGCGNAPIPMYLTMKTNASIIGVELQEEVYKLAVKGIDYNDFNSQVRIINGDIKDIYKTVGGNTFDIVISNPPFFKYQEGSNINKSDYLTIARHEVKISLEDIIKEARSLLTSVGSLYMVHRTERLAEIVILLNKYNFGLKRMRFVYTQENCESSKMFLYEARLNLKSDVVVESPLFVYNSDGTYSKEVREIFNFQKTV
jgi:tRNA1(Val) A37 N6-methylase TrmN6